MLHNNSHVAHVIIFLKDADGKSCAQILMLSLYSNKAVTYLQKKKNLLSHVTVLC